MKDFYKILNKTDRSCLLVTVSRGYVQTASPNPTFSISRLYLDSFV